jgi:NADPH-dependent 2,4-dienoyl-CoA reductase/sulfur reductase-like enzyme
MGHLADSGQAAVRDGGSQVHDVVIVGAGIVGLATAYQLLRARPGLRLCILDK